jgi:toxin YoeB
MKVVWTEQAWQDYLYWRRHDAGTLQKINALIEDIQRNPFRGLGKPEALKFALSGWWSRRITQEHRLVYRISGRDSDRLLEIAQCRYHY